MRPDATPPDAAGWPDEVFGLLRSAGVRQVAWVPDAGHARVIDRVLADPEMVGIPLTTEEEGVALGCGAWLRNCVSGVGKKNSRGSAPGCWR